MTLEDFYTEVLQKLGVLAAEESPSAADRLISKNKYEQVHAEFSRRDIVPWFDDEDVPNWASDAFSIIVASRLAKTFGLPADKRAELKGDEVAAITTIVADGQRRESRSNETIYY